MTASWTGLEIAGLKEAQERIDTLTRSMIMIQERERERISLDLHDQVAQDLAALRLALLGVEEETRPLNPELSRRVAQISETVKRILQDVREISYELRPPGFVQHDLVGTLQRYCGVFSSRNGLPVELDIEGADALRPTFDIGINLFRVTQEALSNIARHAQARRIVIRVKGTKSTIILSVTDDGKGFDLQKASDEAFSEKRMGLWCMGQRISRLRGEMKITSKAGAGTEIVVEVPVGEERHEGPERGPDR
ncbi:MAG: sensor histidine kinase [Pseudomonadota bacterium]